MNNITGGSHTEKEIAQKQALPIEAGERAGVCLWIMQKRDEHCLVVKKLQGFHSPIISSHSVPFYSPAIALPSCAVLKGVVAAR